MTKQEQKNIDLCNSLLLERLGTKEGQQRYRWVLGEDPGFLRAVPERDPEGHPMVDYHCACGVNRSVHAPWCKSLILPLNRHHLANPWPWLENRWVLAGWVPPPPRESWSAMFRDTLPYPSRGILLPVGDSRKTLALLPGDSPSVTVTSEICDALLKNPDGKKLTSEMIDYFKSRDARRKKKFFEIAKEAAPASDPDRTQGNLFTSVGYTKGLGQGLENVTTTGK